MSKSYIFGPHKGGTPQEHVLYEAFLAILGGLAASGYIEVAAY